MLAVLAILVPVLGVALLLQPAPTSWLGAAGLAAGLVLATRTYGARIADRWRRLSPAARRRWLEGGCVALILALALVAIGGDPTDRLVAEDHTVHFFKAWQLNDVLLPDGRLQGWSHRLFAGYPANYLYPVLGDMIVVAVFQAGFGLWSLDVAYGLAFWLVIALSAYAVYRFGHAMTGSRLAGLLAAFFLLADVGAPRYGGWDYVVHFGVWHQPLSLSLVLLALARLPRLAGPTTPFGQDPRAFAGAACLVGLAILAHPIQLVFLPLVFLVLAAALSLSAERHGPTPWLRLAAATALGAVVGAGWLLPFLSTRSLVQTIGIPWESAYELGRGLLELDTLPGTPAAVVGLGLLGAVLAARRRTLGGLFTLGMALALLVFTSSTVIDALHLPDHAGAFSKVQWKRMAIMLKPFWFVLAGLAVRELVRLAAARRPPPLPTGRLAALAAAATLLAAPLASGVFEGAWHDALSRHVTHASDRPLAAERQALAAWARDGLPRDTFYRVALLDGLHSQDLVDLAPALDLPVVISGYMPVTNYVFKPQSTSRAALRALNVRFAISDDDLPPTDFEPIRAFGALRVYRFLHWQRQPFTVLGGGEVTLERFDDERIEVRAGPGAHGTLRLHVPWFPRWRAERDGQPLRIAMGAHPDVADDGLATMDVPLAPGVTTFRFERSTLDSAAWWLTLLGLLTCALVAFGARRTGLVGRLAALPDAAVARLDAAARGLAPAGRWVGAAALIGAVAVAFALAGAPRGPLPGFDGQVRLDLLDALRTAEVSVEGASAADFGVTERARRRCDWVTDHFACGDGRWDRVGPRPSSLRPLSMQRCLVVQPRVGERLQLAFHDLPGGRLVGSFGTAQDGGPELGRRAGLPRVELDLRVDGESRWQLHGPLQPGPQPFDLELPEAGHSVTFEIAAEPVAGRHLCLVAQVLARDGG